MALRNELRTQGDLLFRYRSYLPVVIILPALYLFITGARSVIHVPETDRYAYELCCLALAALGELVRIQCVGHSARNTSGRNSVEGQIADSINSTGPYSLLRHPLYLGNFLMWLGLAALTQHFWFILVFTGFYWLYYERIMYAEEEFLIGKFGEAYLAWSARTPPFIPKLSAWKRSTLPFSWRKVIRREKSSIVNLFLLFFAFQAARSWWQTGTVKMDAVWIWCLGLAVAWYVVVKGLQKTTKLLVTDR